MVTVLAVVGFVVLVLALAGLALWLYPDEYRQVQQRQRDLARRDPSSQREENPDWSPGHGGGATGT